MNKPACPVHIALLALNCMSDNVVLLECLAMGACRPCMHTALLCLLMLALSCRVSLTTLVRLMFEFLCTLVCTRGSRDVPTFALAIFDLATTCGGASRRASLLSPTPGSHKNPGCTQMTHNLACHIFIPLEVRCFTLEVRFTRSWVGHPMSIWSDV